MLAILDTLGLAAAIIALLWRRHLYVRMFPGLPHSVQREAIKTRTDITIYTILFNLLILFTDSIGVVPAERYWILLVATGTLAIVLLPFFIGYEVMIIRERIRANN
jgi:hypothetical protein